MIPKPKPHEIIIESESDIVVRCVCGTVLWESHPTDMLSARVSLLGLTQLVQDHYMHQVAVN